LNPIWRPVVKVPITGEIPPWQTRAFYSCAARWNTNPVGEFLGQVFIVLPCRLLIFLACLPIAAVGVVLVWERLYMLPFTMLGRWYWSMYLIHMARKELRGDQ
jgi:hypothetical protein